MVQTLGNVNYNQNTRFTKKGNVYQKTNAAKWIGAGVGAGYGLARNAKHIFKGKELLEEIGTTFDNLKGNLMQIFQSISIDDTSLQEYLKSPEFKKLFDNMPKICLSTAIAAGIIAATVLGLIIGSVVNKIVNKVRANKADKNAQQITNNPTIITQNTNNEAKTLSKNGFSTFQKATKQ